MHTHIYIFPSTTCHVCVCSNEHNITYSANKCLHTRIMPCFVCPCKCLLCMSVCTWHTCLNTRIMPQAHKPAYMHVCMHDAYFKKYTPSLSLCSCFVWVIISWLSYRHADLVLQYVKCIHMCVPIWIYIHNICACPYARIHE
jgi:hypothetical protein